MAALRKRFMMVVVAVSLLGGLVGSAGCSLKLSTSPDPAPGPGSAPSAGAISNESSGTAEADVEVVDGKKLRDLAAAGATIVDVRTEDEFELEHLPEAVSVPSAKFTKTADKWATDDAVVVYGSKDAKAQTAAAWLVRNGFQSVYRLKGGIEAWDGDHDGVLAKYRLDKPSVIYIYSTTDTVCAQMTPEIHKLAKKHGKRVAFQDVDVLQLVEALIQSASKEPTKDQVEAAEALGVVWIDSVPTIVLTEPDPRSYRKIEGLDGLRVLYAWLQEH